MSKEHDEAMAEIIKPENLIKDSVRVSDSPSGKYQLRTNSFKSEKGWNCTQGTVTFSDGSVITIVNRNYSSFPFTWVEEHPDGHDYLICGETYMGQTVIQLDTGERWDYNTAKGREGFCWVDYKASKDKTKLVVCGCYWACPYELWIVDFTNPDYFGSIFDKGTPEHRWNILARIDDVSIEDYKWNDDGDLEISCERYVFKLDENGKMMFDENGDEIEEVKKTKMIWRAPKLEVLEE